MFDFNPKLFLQPLFLAAATGIAINFSGISPPTAIMLPIEMLGDVSIPLMLFALGARMTETDLSQWRDGLMGAILRPLLGVLAALGCIALLPLTALQQQALILFSVLPPAVLNFLLAERYQQQPHRVAAIVLIGNLASLIIVPLALWFVM